VTDFVSWIGEILVLDIATVGTVAITPGLVLAASMIFSFALKVYGRLKSKG
jgi:hypothetical protein